MGNKIRRPRKKTSFTLDADTLERLRLLAEAEDRSMSAMFHALVWRAPTTTEIRAPSPKRRAQ